MSRAEGTWGEAQVANFLRRRGYQLLAHSYHCRFGEVDLIARQGSMLCFVEVKTRTNLSVGLPREYVTRQKQEKLRRTAACYLARAMSWTAPCASTSRRSTPTRRTALLPRA